jgi:von Willebrand factor type D domain
MQNHRMKLCAALAAFVLSVAWTGAGRADEPAATPKATASPPAPTISPDLGKSTKEQRDAWRVKMLQAPREKGTCYTAAYPDTTWHEVPCTVAPRHYFGPETAMGPRHPSNPIAETVGNGDDYVADPANPITLAIGSFDTVTGATSVQTENAGAGGDNGPNLWSLQLNSDFFPTTLCKNLGMNCQGFAQYVYDNSSQSAYVQYWLVSPSGSCPNGWTSFGGDCVQTAPASKPFASAPTATDLADMSVSGSGSGVTVYWGGNMISAPDMNIIPDLASNWGDAEFNIFGDGGGGQATFNNGTTMTVRTQVDTGNNIAPNCIVDGWTAETNNLNLISTPAMVKPAQYPSIVFDQSNASSTPASCSTSIGDTHITTFDGLYYDFQASGDFVLADAGPDLIVQARQESGAKVFDNPNVTMNTVVAAQMGSNRMVIYDSPEKVVVNGKTTNVANNQIIDLADDVQLVRTGTVYALSRSNGDLVRAQLYNGWMDIAVGLGHRARASAKGILASPSRTVLSMRDGTQLKEPVSANDLYQRYAKSWLVQTNESLFGEPLIAFGAPAKLITVSDLDAAAEAKARAACTAAGVSDAAHLDSCTLDAVVLKDNTAIKAFTHPIVAKTIVKPVDLQK